MISLPPTRIEPVIRLRFTSWRPSTAIEETLLPDPDSPTIPSVCPSLTVYDRSGDRLHEPVVGGELDGQVFDDEKGLLATVLEAAFGSVVGQRLRHTSLTLGSRKL